MKLKDELRDAFYKAAFGAIIFAIIHFIFEWLIDSSTRAKLVVLGLILICAAWYGIDYISHPHPREPLSEEEQLAADEATDKALCAWMYDKDGNYINEDAERVARAETAIMYRDGIEAYDREIARQAKLHGKN